MTRYDDSSPTDVSSLQYSRVQGLVDHTYMADDYTVHKAEDAVSHLTATVVSLCSVTLPGRG